MSTMRIVATQAAVGIVLIAIWHGASVMHLVDPRLLPSPGAVAAALGTLLQSSTFLGNAGDTLLRVLAAFAIGAPLALAVGFLLGEHVGLEKAFGPLLNLVLAVPQSIFLPLFVLLFGLGFTEKLMFGITHVFFVVVVNTIAAVRQVSRSYVVAARSWGASRTRIYRTIYLPAMAPQVVTGLRFGMIFDIIGILLAEMYASSSGLGVLLLRWGENTDVVKLMAATIFIAAVTIAINEAMRLWEARVGRWTRTAHAE